MEQEQYGEIRGEQFTQGSAQRSKGQGTLYSNSTFRAQEKFRQLLDANEVASSDTESLPQLKIDKGSVARQDKAFPSTFNLMQHDIDTQEEEYENQAIASVLEQQADGEIRKNAHKRDT